LQAQPIQMPTRVEDPHPYYAASSINYLKCYLSELSVDIAQL